METTVKPDSITFKQGVWGSTILNMRGDNSKVKVTARGMLCQPVELILDRKEIQQLRIFLNNLEELEKAQQEPIVIVDNIVEVPQVVNATEDWF